MGDLSQMSILLILLMEVTVLTYLEHKAWRTLYTPLCALMLPYVLVLFVTMGISGRFGFIDFNYESLYIWIYGLPLFAIPSLCMASLLEHRGLPRHHSDPYPIPSKLQPADAGMIPPVLIVLAVILTLLLFVKLLLTLRNGFFLFGTDDFADEFSGHGLWAHLRTMLIPIIILAFYYVRRGPWWLWLLIILMMTLQFVNMVKGTIVIPVMSAVLMRLYAGKTHMNLKLVIGAVGGAVLVFYLIYMVIPLLGNGGEADQNLVEFVAQHILHYLTSGTLGWSCDVDQGMPDQGSFEYIVTPFVNIAHALRGEELISPVNHIYWNTATSATTYTNVRTFFGTLSIYTDALQFVVYLLVVSTFVYGWRVAALLKQDVYLYVIHFYYCGLLAMGWFEFYFFHLDAIEIPLLTLFYGWIASRGKEVGHG